MGPLEYIRRPSRVTPVLAVLLLCPVLSASGPCPGGVTQAAAAVARLHGLPELPVRCETVSETELEHRLLGRIEASQPVDLRTQLEISYRLGLLAEPPSGELESRLLGFLSGQVLGYYDPVRDTVVLSEDGAGGMGIPGMDTMIWAHEIEHIYQERRFGLGSRLLALRGNTDAQLAASAVAEGDAVLVMARVAAAAEHPTPAELADAAGEILSALGTVRRSVAPPGIPRIFVDQLLFPYEEGTRYLSRVLRTGGWDAVARELAGPPESTEQLLHPDRRHDRPQRFTASDLPPAAGWDAVLTDVTGEWGFAEWLGLAVPHDQALRAAAGWDGDLGRMSRSPSGLWRLDMVSAWDTETDAREAEGVLRSALPRLLRLGPGPATVELQRDGRRLLLTATGRPAAGARR